MIDPAVKAAICDLLRFETLVITSTSWTEPALASKLGELEALSQRISAYGLADNWKALPQSMFYLAQHVTQTSGAGRLGAGTLAELSAAREACYDFDFDLKIEDHPLREQSRFFTALAGLDIARS